MLKKLVAERKKKLINDYLQQVMESHPSYYYASTADVARAIHQQIKLTISRLAIDEQILIKRLSSRDIEIILNQKFNKK